MKKNSSLPRNLALAVSCLATVSGAAHAATFSAPFTNGMVDSMVAGATAGTYAADNNKILLQAASGSDAALNLVKATAWANTYQTGSSSSESYNFVKSRLTDQGVGLGITALNTDGSDFEATTAPDHAIDNNGAREFVLFEFDQAVTLNSLSLSYVSGDSDLSILAFTGTGDVEALLHGSAVAAANAVNGLDSTNTGGNLDDSTKWKSLNISNAGTGSESFSYFQDNSIASKYWLVGAYNSYLGTSLSDSTKDYLKLSGLGGKFTTPPPPCTSNCTPGGHGVPEPSTLTLAALGILGGIRRWKRKAA